MGYLDYTGLAYFWEKIKSNFFPATKEIPANADLNDYTTPGVYCCLKNSTAHTLTNSPTSDAFSLQIYRTAFVSDSGNEAYRQILMSYPASEDEENMGRIWLRSYYTVQGWSPWSQILTSLDRPVDYTSAGWTLDTYADHCWHKMATFKSTNTTTDRRAVFIVTDSLWHGTTAPNGRPDLKIGLLHVHIRKTVGTCATSRRLSFNLNAGYDPNDFVLVYNPVDDSDELWTRIPNRYNFRTFNLMETGLNYGGNRYYQTTVNPIEMYRRMRDSEGYASYPTGEGYVAIKAENAVIEQPSRGLLDLGLYYNCLTSKRLTTANAFLAGNGKLEYYNSTSSISLEDGAFTYPNGARRDAHVLRLPWDNVGADGACYDSMLAVPNSNLINSAGYPASLGWRTGYGAGCAEQDTDGNWIHTTYSDWYHLIDDRYTIDGVHVKKQHTTHYGVCSTAAATAEKTVDIPHFDLVDGAFVIIKFKYSNSAGSGSTTLNVSGTGAKNIKYKSGNAPASGMFAANKLCMFVYDGTYWQVIGDWDFHTRQFDRLKRAGGIYPKEAITTTTIIVNDGTGYIKLDSRPFDITYSILATSSALTANTQNANVYSAYPFAIKNTQGFTMTQHAPVFIKGTLNGVIFTPVSSTPLVQTLPNTEDGYQYLYLGYAYTTANLQLVETHPIVEYVGGAIRPYQTAIATNADVDSIFD